MQHEPNRVLHMIASLNVGGSQAMVMNLYRAIDRNVIQFDFIIDHPEEVELKDEIESLGGRVYILPTFKGRNVREIRKAWNKFFSEHSEYRILHTHSRSYASIYLPIAKKHGLITIAHSHSTSNGRGITAVIKNIMQYPIRNQADYMFACSEEAGIWLFGQKAAASDRFRVIPNAIDSREYVFDYLKRERIRNELGVCGCFVIGHVGRLMPPKNHRFLLECFSEYMNVNSKAVLLLVGDGDLRSEIEKQAGNLKIKDRVIFAGTAVKASIYYQAMDAFVFPSFWEGLGMAVVEAQASGLPCYVSNTVPKKVDIGAGLVRFLSLNLSAKEWADEIRQINRADTSSYIKESGFDIQSNSEMMQSFYMELMSK